MKIEELDEVESDGRSYNHSDDRVSGRMIVRVDSKRALVGAGLGSCSTRPLLYNVFRNKIQAEFRWWDQIDQYFLLGAVPSPKDVLQLKQLGVGAVITLNEPYETWFQHHSTM
ncbi:putative dual specificity protein phosphatase DSP8 [Camellia lanceoleosa]|uniref:Dual specificity protein phosphatase DSP8 n=1 Tax=Camellia lanceoleosa TaxID=1840588 RepID=A0ACC0F1C6_9ERIC|nr:putative dual specificity protein phosphatase DSP8 [Camellia lanceoleosa]